jgi:hypothetical protein
MAPVLCAGIAVLTRGWLNIERVIEKSEIKPEFLYCSGGYPCFSICIFDLNL